MESISSDIRELSYNPIFLAGSISLFHILLAKNIPIPTQNLDTLFASLLNFAFNNSNPFDSPRIRSFTLLSQLSKRLRQYSILIQSLSTLHRLQAWRTEKVADWNIDSEISEENVREYVGLVNMGATCYVNAVVQQLFMLVGFREGILAAAGNEGKGTAVYELQHLFAVLWQRKVRNYRAKEFYEAMRVDIGVQRDASEFLIELFDKLNKVLKRKLGNSLIDDTFGIKTESRIVCSVCNKVSEITEDHFMLQLEVRSKFRLAESLQDFIKPELLQEANAYLCEVCGRKVPAEKQENIVSLPAVLLVHLKRFEVAHGSLHKKVNSFFEFPLELDMQTYSSVPADSCSEPSNDSLKYVLKGVIIHVGSLDSGHYFTITKEDGRERWVQFNDTAVKEFDVRRLPDEAFGSALRQCSNRVNSAYILVYQRKALHVGDRSSTVADAEEEVAEFVGSEVIPSKLERKLRSEYAVAVERKVAFNPSYSEFVLNVLKDCSRQGSGMVGKDDVVRLLNYALNFFLTVLIRSNAAENTFEFAKIIEEACSTSKEFALNVVESFSSLLILREFLLDCPKAAARKCVAEILKVAVDAVYRTESAAVEKYLAGKTVETPSLIYLMSTFLSQLTLINKHTCGEYFGVLRKLIRLRLSRHALNYPLLGVMLEAMRLPVAKPWSESGAAILPNLPWKEQGVVPVSEKVSVVFDRQLIEKQFALQFPYMIEAVDELIKDYTNPCDSVEIERIAEETIKRLYEHASLTAAGQIAVSKLIVTIAKIEHAKYKDKVFGLVLSRLKTCTSIELPAVLYTIERVLTVVDEDAFKGVFGKVAKEIVSELKGYYTEEYFTVICYADFVLNLAMSNKNCLNYPETKGLAEKMQKKLESYKSQKKGVTLFRYMSIILNKDNTRIYNLSKEANLERIELLKDMKKAKLPEEKPKSKWVMQEDINDGMSVDVYMYSSI